MDAKMKTFFDYLKYFKIFEIIILTFPNADERLTA